MAFKGEDKYSTFIGRIQQFTKPEGENRLCSAVVNSLSGIKYFIQKNYKKLKKISYALPCFFVYYMVYFYLSADRKCNGRTIRDVVITGMA